MNSNKIDISNGSSVIEGYSLFHSVGSSCDSHEWKDIVKRYIPSEWDLESLFNSNNIVSPNAKTIRTVKHSNGDEPLPLIYVHLYTNFLEAARYNVLNLLLEMLSDPLKPIVEHKLIVNLKQDFNEEHIDTVVDLISKIDLTKMKLENLVDMQYVFEDKLISLLVANLESLFGSKCSCGNIFVFRDLTLSGLDEFTRKYMIQYIAVTISNVDIYPATCSNAIGLARTMLCYSNTLSDADVKRVLDYMDKKGFLTELRRCGCVIPLAIENLPDKLPQGVYEKFLETYIYRCLFVFSQDNINMSSKNIMMIENIIK